MSAPTKKNLALMMNIKLRVHDYVMHTVVFKCIGCQEYQDTQSLCAARDLIAQGEFVPVRLTPEPINIKGAKAVAFE